MTKNYLLTGLVTLMMVLFLSGCDNNDVESLESHPSYRDWVYEGQSLSVTLNGNPMPSVTSVSVKSELLNPNIDHDRDPDKVVSSSNPTYTSTIRIAGFPSPKVTSSFVTVSDLQGFKGTATIDGVAYGYEAVFTGDPLTTHDRQGLVLHFTTE